MTIFTYPDVFSPVDAAGNLRGPVMGEADVTIRELMSAVQMALFDGLIYSTRAALYGDLAHAANSWALVIGDPTSGYDGLYQKSGSSGAGSWSRVGDVPGSGFIKATDAGAGTANAIVATSPAIPATDGAALIALNIFETNTASPVTVAFNGGSALTIKSNTGNDIAAGGLTAGMVVAGYVSGSTFRLLSDQSSAAIVAAAEAAQAAAEAAADAAAANAASVTGRVAETRADMLLLDETVIDNVFLTEEGRAGNFKPVFTDISTYVTLDTNQAIYVPYSADTTGASGGWVRQRTGFDFHASWGGVIADDATNQSLKINALYQLASTLAYGEFWLPGSLTNKIAIASQLLFNKSNILVRGAGPGHHHDLGVSNTVDFGTALLWTGSTGGGSTMIYLGPSAGATNRRVSGGGVVDVALYGDLKADYGLVCRSTFHAQIRIYVTGQLTAGAYFGVQSSLGEAADVQHCMIDIRGLMYDATAGKGVVFTGSATANVSYNECWFWFGHYNSTAVEIGNSDHNVFHKIWCYRKSGGTAYAVDVLGGPSNPERARRNVFKQFNAGAGGSIFRGTADYTFPTIDNIIDEFDVGNLQPAPVIGTGATVHWRTDTREHHTQEGRNLSPVLTAIPDADVSMSSATTGTTFQNVPGMSFYLMASSLYRYTVEYVHDGPNTDAKRIFTGPAGATAWAAFDHTTRSATILGPFSSANIDDTAVGTKTRATESGVIKTGATAGTLQLQWAQAVADAGVTTLYRDGTVMTLQKIF